MGLKLKRFLIIWCLFHSIALALNLIPIKGEYVSYESVEGKIENLTNYYITDGKYDSEKGFWPFVKIYDKEGYEFRFDNYDGGLTYRIKYARRFNGIFYNYGLRTFTVYILIGLAIVFLPLLWRNKNRIKQSKF